MNKHTPQSEFKTPEVTTWIVLFIEADLTKNLQRELGLLV